jgi:hypothetical protein
MSFSFCTVTYVANAAGASAADIFAAIDSGAVPVPPSFLQLSGATINSDLTTTVGGEVTRTIKFNLTPAFKVLYPDTSDQRAPFWHFMQGELQKSLIGPVLPGPPVLS